MTLICWLLGHRWEWLGPLFGGTNPNGTKRGNHLYGCRRCCRAVSVHFLAPPPTGGPS